ncbi:protein adenylyltransferase SelO [Macrococcoides caseolyticum]|uniref:protein adenylyltransferase SelO n=1 Tax=Macrococcoides caseolyticum TaxID=69966 RepID=UPI001F16FF6F|nr:YdiU family protein [Macrococcus caseolyticus]MCE4956640.1 YdiU family protein [Macrococcus caseolyticus]
MFNFNFDNSFLNLSDDFFELCKPEQSTQPEVIIFNNDLANQLNINRTLQQHPKYLTGNEILPGSQPSAHAYAGHQFGHFTMLGDGRAHVLGEHITKDNKRYDIQLKGSGRTIFSRSGDGRAAIGPMLREYIISEAMYHLGIPTTRSLAVSLTGDNVYRETSLPGAVLVRIAQSNLRVGTFEYAVRTEDKNNIQHLADYAINRHYPEIKNDENRYLSLLNRVIEKQASLIAKWQSIGFIHGVMNTDNMTISGETIDYGPCAFMDTYNPTTVFSSIDQYGRYAYNNQPSIALWNLTRFAETLISLIDEDETKAIQMAETALGVFQDKYVQNYIHLFGQKIGIENINQQDFQLVIDLLELFEKYEADFTSTFRSLATNQFIELEMYQHADVQSWYQRWQTLIKHDKINDHFDLMQSVNLAVIPRNHLVEEALSDATIANDYSKLNQLLEAIRNPYSDYHEDKYLKPAPPSDRVYQTYCGT